MSDIDKKVEDYFATRLKSLKIRIGVLAVLLVIVIAYMAWIHAQVTAIDADAVVEVAQYEVQERLPDMERQASVFLIDNAPAMFDMLEENLLAAPAKLRGYGVERINTHAKSRMVEYEAKLDELLERAIAVGIEELEKIDPERSREEQLEFATEVAIEQFEETMTEFFVNLEANYEQDLKGFNDYLEQLADGGDLGPKQRIERELILATLALKDRAEEVEAEVDLGLGDEEESAEGM